MRTVANTFNVMKNYNIGNETAKDIFTAADQNKHFEKGLHIGDQWAINQAAGHIYDLTIKYLPVRWNVRYKLIGHVEDPAIFHCKVSMERAFQLMSAQKAL